jgi:hypothetical protein
MLVPGSDLKHADAIRIMCRLSFFRREYFLNTDLVNQMLSAQVRHVRPFFVIRQFCANAVDHNHNEGSIIHIHPKGAANEFVSAIPYEGAIRIAGEIGFIKTCHDCCFQVRSKTDRATNDLKWEMAVMLRQIIVAILALFACMNPASAQM